MKKIAILQSNYIPWKGYFDLINMVDEFIIYDEVQYTKQDWRNRNIIKTPHGTKWLTIPCSIKHKSTQQIDQTIVSNNDWRKKHVSLLKQHYKKSPFFKQVMPWLEDVYFSNNDQRISAINIHFIEAICKQLNITTPIVKSDIYPSNGDKNHKLIQICQLAEANQYLCGPAAKVYIDTELFLSHGVELEWMDYSNYPEYDQLYSPFTHQVTILDLMFHVGIEDTPKYLKSLTSQQPQK
ncbi:WbqC family protein [Halosquirtibacter xylanolyticus]|uniref:WbqC family protein n=1 Tax=Halosquirtibacter xylanolyticus TaxID=3374599 RepID=UPI003749F2FB|nr:WbqC family protein [Prolixibacteraceae bacterium]